MKPSKYELSADKLASLVWLHKGLKPYLRSEVVARVRRFRGEWRVEVTARCSDRAEEPMFRCAMYQATEGWYGVVYAKTEEEGLAAAVMLLLKGYVTRLETKEEVQAAANTRREQMREQACLRRLFRKEGWGW